jgi:hypothetical protein
MGGFPAQAELKKTFHTWQAKAKIFETGRQEFGDPPVTPIGKF